MLEKWRNTGCSLKIVFFSKILESLPPLLPRQHSAAIGCCTINNQPIGVTVHSQWVESFEGLLQRCRRGRGCSELWKNTIFSEHPVLQKFLSLNFKGNEKVCFVFKHKRFKFIRRLALPKNPDNRHQPPEPAIWMADITDGIGKPRKSHN